MTTIVVLPDMHFPHVDLPRLTQVEEDMRGLSPSHIVQIGDLGDWYRTSNFDKDPRRVDTLNDERIQVCNWLAKLRRQHPDARIDICEGNHEDRMRRYLWSKANALASLPELTVPAMYGLNGLGIGYHGRSGFKQYGVRFKHGDAVRSKAGYTATAEMEAHRCSGVSGHTHRFNSARRTDKEGVTTEWWEIGHLSDISKVEYTSSPDWQPGYMVIYASPDGVEFNPIYL